MNIDHQPNDHDYCPLKTLFDPENISGEEISNPDFKLIFRCICGIEFNLCILLYLGLGGGAIAGIVVAGAIGALACLAFCVVGGMFLTGTGIAKSSAGAAAGAGAAATAAGVPAISQGYALASYGPAGFYDGGLGNNVFYNPGLGNNAFYDDGFKVSFIFWYVFRQIICHYTGHYT